MKKALFSLFVLIAAFSSQAAYLYWQVGDLSGIDSDVTSGSVKATNGSGDPVTLTSYYLYQNGDGLLEWKVYTGNETVSSETQFAAYIDETQYGGSSDWSYYVELANATETVARSSSIKYGSDDYNAYTSAASSSTDLPDVANADTWHAGSGGYTPVPEPTSGLLMLFGAAMLGLKRKNRSRA